MDAPHLLRSRDYVVKLLSLGYRLVFRMRNSPAGGQNLIDFDHNLKKYLFSISSIVGLFLYH